MVAIAPGVAADVGVTCGGAACVGVVPPQAVNRTPSIRQHRVSGVQRKVGFNRINMLTSLLSFTNLLLSIFITRHSQIFSAVTNDKHMGTIIGVLYYYTYQEMRIHP
jgi:hypothetical protein